MRAISIFFYSIVIYICQENYLIETIILHFFCYFSFIFSPPNQTSILTLSSSPFPFRFSVDLYHSFFISSLAYSRHTSSLFYFRVSAGFFYHHSFIYCLTDTHSTLPFFLSFSDLLLIFSFVFISSLIHTRNSFLHFPSLLLLLGPLFCFYFVLLSHYILLYIRHIFEYCFKNSSLPCFKMFSKHFELTKNLGLNLSRFRIPYSIPSRLIHTHSTLKYFIWFTNLTCTTKS